MNDKIPVITIDGPSGTGKGTLSRQLAAALQFNFLDSGAIYRLLALAAREHGVALDDSGELARLSLGLNIRFDHVTNPDDSVVYLDDQDVTGKIRTETCGADASIVAVIPAVRDALLARQRAFQQAPGLVADGRDMGTTVFPAAALKIYLTADREARARRRHKQLMGKGIGVTLASLLKELEARDARDSGRSISPMQPAKDAVIVDTTTLDIEQVFSNVKALWISRSAGV